jgi:hypothetical protein
MDRGRKWGEMDRIQYREKNNALLLVEYFDDF